MMTKMKKRVVPAFLAIMVLLSSFSITVNADASELSELDELKLAAKQEVLAAFAEYDEADYYTAAENAAHNWEALVTIKDDAVGANPEVAEGGAIGEATDDRRVNAAVINALDGMDAVLTKAEADAADLQAYRDTALAEIQEKLATYNQADYTAQGWAAMQAIMAGAVDRLSKCADNTAIDKEKEAIIGEFAEILNAAEKNGAFTTHVGLVSSKAEAYKIAYPEVATQISQQMAGSMAMITMDSVTEAECNAELQAALDALLAPVKAYVMNQLESDFENLDELDYQKLAWDAFEEAYNKAIDSVNAIVADGSGVSNDDVTGLQNARNAYDTAKSDMQSNSTREPDQEEAARKVMTEYDKLIAGGYATEEDLESALLGKSDSNTGLLSIDAPGANMNYATPDNVAMRTIIEMYKVAALNELKAAYDGIDLDKYTEASQTKIDGLRADTEEEIKGISLPANPVNYDSLKASLDPAATEGTIVAGFLAAVAEIEEGDAYIIEALAALDEAFAPYEEENDNYWYTTAGWTAMQTAYNDAVTAIKKSINADEANAAVEAAKTAFEDAAKANRRTEERQIAVKEIMEVQKAGIALDPENEEYVASLDVTTAGLEEGGQGYGLDLLDRNARVDLVKNRTLIVLEREIGLKQIEIDAEAKLAEGDDINEAAVEEAKQIAEEQVATILLSSETVGDEELAAETLSNLRAAIKNARDLIANAGTDAELAAAIEEALADLQAEYDKRDAERKTEFTYVDSIWESEEEGGVQYIYKNAVEDIKNATTKMKIEQAYNSAIAAMDGAKREQGKIDALKELDAYKTEAAKTSTDKTFLDSLETIWTKAVADIDAKDESKADVVKNGAILSIDKAACKEEVRLYGEQLKSENKYTTTGIGSIDTKVGEAYTAIDAIPSKHSETAFDDAYKAAVDSLNKVPTAAGELDAKKAELTAVPDTYTDEKLAEMDNIIAEAKAEIEAAEDTAAVDAIVSETKTALDDVNTLVEETQLVTDFETFVTEKVAIEKPTYTGDEIRGWRAELDMMSESVKSTIDADLMAAFEAAEDAVAASPYEIANVEKVERNSPAGVATYSRLTLDPNFAKTGEDMAAVVVYEVEGGSQIILFAVMEEKELESGAVQYVVDVNKPSGASIVGVTVYIYDTQGGGFYGTFSNEQVFPADQF